MISKCLIYICYTYIYIYMYAQSHLKPVKLEMVLRSPAVVFCKYPEALGVLAIPP